MAQATKLHTNPHVEAATIQMLAVNLKHEDATDEYGEVAGQIIDRCWSLMGLPDPEDLTVKQLARHDAVMEAILDRAFKMERALTRARLVSKHN
jgi:hypothetical protein